MLQEGGIGGAEKISGGGGMKRRRRRRRRRRMLPAVDGALFTVKLRQRSRSHDDESCMSAGPTVTHFFACALGQTRRAEVRFGSQSEVQ